MAGNYLTLNFPWMLGNVGRAWRVVARDLVEKSDIEPFELLPMPSNLLQRAVLMHLSDSGPIRAFWLEVTRQAPEPASVAPLAFGLAGLGFSRRRKQ